MLQNYEHIGTQVILITREPGNNETQTILIISDPGNTGKPYMLVQC